MTADRSSSTCPALSRRASSVCLRLSLFISNSKCTSFAGLLPPLKSNSRITSRTGSSDTVIPLLGEDRVRELLRVLLRVKRSYPWKDSELSLATQLHRLKTISKISLIENDFVMQFDGNVCLAKDFLGSQTAEALFSSAYGFMRK